jgi:hypothetical protein
LGNSKYKYLNKESFMSKRQSLFSMLLFFTSLVPNLKAVDIAVYNFTGSSPSSLAPSSADPNVTAGNVNFTGSSASQTALSGILAINPPINAVDAASAVTNNSFYQFEVTPNAGSTMNLTSLTFDGSTATNAPSNGYVVRSSADGYASDLQTAGFTTQYPTFTNYSVSLTGSQFQNLTSAISFRVYTYRTLGSGASAAYDNLKLTGTVATVPEPSTYALAAIATGTIGYLARRRRHAAVQA